MALKIKTPPASKPVTLQELKDWCRVLHDEEDALLEDRIATASECLQDDTNRAMLATVFELWLDGFPCEGEIEIPRAPLISAASVEYYGTDDTKYTFPSTDYYVDTVSTPGRVVLGYSKSWPSVTLRPANSVCVTFTAGYASLDAIPKKAKEAILLKAAGIYVNREDQVVGGSQVTTATRLPDGYERLISRLRVFTRGSF